MAKTAPVLRPNDPNVPAIVRRVVTETLACEEADVTTHTTLREDLGADNLDIIELAMALETAYDMDSLLDDYGADEWVTVKDVIDSMKKAGAVEKDNG